MRTAFFRRTILLFSYFIIPVFSASAQPEVSVFTFLSKRDSALLTLELDLPSLLAGKKTNTYFSAILRLENGQEIQTQVRPRGKFRRRISEIPPLKFKFSKKDLKSLHLDTLNEVRLVLPQSFDNEGEARLQKEYLAYRMYEKISPYHVKARLIRLCLYDQSTRSAHPTVWAMLLEHEEEILARLGGKAVQEFGLPVDSLDSYYAALNVAFQYMIGNTDWSVPDQRNILLYKETSGGKIIPIPYDFDFSGLVDAPYATPTKESGLSSVRDRALMADGLNKRALKQAIKVLMEQETYFIESCKRAHLNHRQTKLVQQYLADFFSAIKQYQEVPVRIKATS